MTGAEFEAQFIAASKVMPITATLPASGYVPAWVWASDGVMHIRAPYCGCERHAVVIRQGRDAFSVCPAHGLQPIGVASRIRVNHHYLRGAM